MSELTPRRVLLSRAASLHPVCVSQAHVESIGEAPSLRERQRRWGFLTKLTEAEDIGHLARRISSQVKLPPSLPPPSPSLSALSQLGLGILGPF
jgi:hypothetical protein